MNSLPVCDASSVPFLSTRRTEYEYVLPCAQLTPMAMPRKSKRPSPSKSMPVELPVPLRLKPSDSVTFGVNDCAAAERGNTNNRAIMRERRFMGTLLAMTSVRQEGAARSEAAHDRRLTAFL